MIDMKARIPYNLFRTMVALVLLALCSCTAQEETAGGKTPLRIGNASAERSAAATRTSATRASDTRLLNGDSDAIGLFIKAENGYQAVNNRKYSYAIPVWKTEGEQLLLGSANATLAAYYPYWAEQNSTVILTGCTYQADKEFYYLPFSAGYLTSTVNLNLRRAYALIRFSLIRGTDEPSSGDAAYMGDGKVTAFSFTATLMSRGELDLFTGTITGNSPSSQEMKDDTPCFLGTSLAPAQKDFLIVPCSYSGDLTFKVTIDGKKMDGKVTDAALCGMGGALKEGVMYEIKVVVRPTELAVAKVLAVNGWDTTEIGGELENK